MNASNQDLNNKYGCWIVNGIPFTSKIDALKYSSKSGNSLVNFYYHDHIWEKFNRTILGKNSLENLYKQRAQQLRDSYDYLILHYSGGSDSHNILHTFLKNNIKLDEVCVKWIKPLQDGKFYVPNTYDKTARNSASEWDFSIKPTLDWLKSNRPEIKINVIDYGSNLSDKEISVDASEQRIIDMNINRGSLGTFSMWVNPSLESTALRRNSKKVGHIYGIDKPMLIIKDKKIYFQFVDSVFENTILPQGRKKNQVEMFYWSADFPLLPIEQAYQSALYFKASNTVSSVLWNNQPLSQSQILKKFEDQGNFQKSILYSDSWNVGKFQVDKPNLLRSDWYFWTYENLELQKLRQNWEFAMKNLTSDIDKRLLIVTESTNLLKPIRTKPFYLLSLD